MEITTSFQGREKCNELKARLSKLSYNPDLRKVLHNIEIMVSEISKIEVICRQTKNNSRLDEPLKKLNDSIKHLEQLIFIATLMN